MIDKHSQIRRVRTLVQTLSFSSFYGEVTIKMESGNIVYVEVIENRRVSPEEAQELLTHAVHFGEDLSIRPLRNSGNASLVRTSRKGALQDVVPIPQKE